MTAKFRVDFQVKELLEEGDASEARFVSMGDVVRLRDLCDFFQRCGLAVENVFMGCRRPMSLVLREDIDFSRGLSKINLIKALRLLSRDLTLFEAKALVEMSPGTPLVRFEDEESAWEAMKTLKELGVDHGVGLVFDDRLTCNVNHDPFMQQLVRK